MTKSTQRATSYVDYRASKRPKHTGTPVHYSTRIITWEEQLRLPERFHEEEGVWPAVAILDQRGSGDRKEYLLEWEPHPETGEVFEPTWVRDSTNTASFHSANRCRRSLEQTSAERF